VDEEGNPSDFMEALGRAMTDEPEAEPEPSPEAEAEVVPEPEEDLSPSAKNFKKIKSDRDNARNELEALKQQLEEAQQANGGGDFDRVKQERDDLSDELKIAAIERHPEFKKKYEGRAGTLVGQAKAIVGSGTGLDDKIAQVIFMAESDERTEQLDDVFSELPVSKQARLASIISEMDTLQDERINEIKSHHETYDKLSEQDMSARRDGIDNNHKLFDRVAEQSAPALEFYQLRDGDESWNSEVASSLELARNIFTGTVANDDLALASLWAAVGPKYREAYGTSMEVNRRLKAQIKELTGSNPSVSADAEALESGEDIGFIDHLHQVMEEE